MPDRTPPAMDCFLSVRFRVGDREIIEVDAGSTDVWFAIKALRSAADGLSEWGEAQESLAASAPGGTS